jgi:hypothetical protein
MDVISHGLRPMPKIEMISNYKCTFGLIEGKSTSVMHEQMQVSMNSTGEEIVK